MLIHNAKYFWKILRKQNLVYKNIDQVFIELYRVIEVHVGGNEMEIGISERCDRDEAISLRLP